ncbi:ATP-binding protein [Agrobacterium tumefaciens]|uniref:sensor histidine kinase n=1 Tax=Agrobacterium tumefaciens TaxID=358 RepID=UPI00157557D0|nr:sensor histidine kinase [Agrobacterium tumefaciens]NTZ92424.1 hypothetical protein [Agrobacterium tumefaciens]
MLDNITFGSQWERVVCARRGTRTGSFRLLRPFWPLTFRVWHMSILKLFLAMLIALFLGATATNAGDGASEIRIREVPGVFSGSLSLDGFIDVALVENAEATLDDLLAQHSLFAPIAGHDINLGFVRTSAWMRFALALSPQAEHPQNLLLSLTPNFTDELEAYVGVQKAGMSAADFDVYEMGDHSPRSRANVNTSANILPLELQPGQTTIIYLRARNHDASLNVSAEILSPAHYEYGSIIQNIVRGMWFGGMGILLVIQFFFFYFDRKRFYIILAMDILAVSSTYFGSLGLARLLFFNEGGLGNDYLTSTSSWFGLIAGALSIAAILDLRPRYPLIDLYFRFAALVGVVGIFCVLYGVNRYFVLVAGPVILILTTMAMIVAFLDFIRSRDAQHGLNLAAFGLLWAGLMATNGQRYGVLPLPVWVAGSYAATSIIHFTLLTGSLAVRLRNAEAAAREADRRAVLAANAAEQHANDLVLKRTRELEEAKGVAEHALHAELKAQEQQVRFMEVISHQYRTPLGVIRTNLESVRLTLPKNDDANRARLDRARVGISRLVEVLEVNLTRSKLQGPAYQPAFSETSVADLIGIIIPGAHDLFHGATINVTVTSEAERARIRADREMLRLAVINLLENAFKFSAPAGSSMVWLDVFCEGDEVHLRIRDKGIGIAGQQPEDLVRNSVRGANSAHIEGTGMGLSLVKRATDAHGGRFVLAGRAGGGTEATIALPVPG